MSSPPQIRRTDRLLPEDTTREILARGFAGRLATVGADGAPYCVPLLYVWMDDQIFVHNTAAMGHLRANVDHEKRVCFEMDEASEVFDYGRFECDSSVAYRSVIAFGTIRIIDEIETKQRFCEALLKKYGKPDSGRPKGFFPRLDRICVYAIAVERLTGKENPLPGIADQWPAKDRTMTPNAKP